MRVILPIAIILILMSGILLSKDKSEALCKASESSTPYCKYTGKIEKVYLNSEGLALIYLGADFSKSGAKQFGYEVSSSKIMAIDVTENELNRLIYQSIVSAMAEDYSVEFHARGTLNGYIKLDRVWITK